MAHDRYSKDLEAIKKRGVNVIKTPDKLLTDQLNAWNKVIAEQIEGTVLCQGRGLAEGMGRSAPAPIR